MTARKKLQINASWLAGEIARLHVMFALRKASVPELILTSLRVEGMPVVVDRMLRSSIATHLQTLGNSLPEEWIAEFREAYRKAATEALEQWIASHEPKR